MSRGQYGRKKSPHSSGVPVLGWEVEGGWFPLGTTAGKTGSPLQEKDDQPGQVLLMPHRCPKGGVDERHQRQHLKKVRLNGI